MIEIKCDKCKKKIEALDIKVRPKLTPKVFYRVGTILEIDIKEDLHRVGDKILCEQCYEELAKKLKEAENFFFQYDKGN